MAITPLCQGKRKKLSIPCRRRSHWCGVVLRRAEFPGGVGCRPDNLSSLRLGLLFSPGFHLCCQEASYEGCNVFSMCVCGCECETRVFVYVEVLSILDGLYCVQQHAQISMFNVPERPSGSWCPVKLYSSNFIKVKLVTAFPLYIRCVFGFISGVCVYKSSQLHLIVLAEVGIAVAVHYLPSVLVEMALQLAAHLKCRMSQLDCRTWVSNSWMMLNITKIVIASLPIDLIYFCSLFLLIILIVGKQLTEAEIQWTNSLHAIW